MSHNKAIRKERIRVARQAGKSEIVKALLEHFYFEDTLKYFEKEDIDKKEHTAKMLA